MEFNMYKGRLLVDEETIPKEGPLRKLYLHEDNLKLLMYVYMLCDLSADNPLKDIPLEDKDGEARSIVFEDEYFNFNKAYGAKTANTVDAAINFYREHIVTDAQKDIQAYNHKMDQLRVMLEETEPAIQRNINENNEAVSFSTNIDIINGTLRDIVNIISAKASLTTMYVQGTIPKKLRGGLSPAIMGKINASDSL